MADRHVPRRWPALSMLVLLLALFISPLASASPTPSPVGVWKTIDDKTGKEKALVQIQEQGGELQGRIVHLFNPSKPDPVCEKCEGERRDQPITGMQILWGFKREGKDWSQGHILDPEEGKVYKARLNLVEDGAVLEVRGFIGVPALGRTQRWSRHEAAAGETAARKP